MRSTSQEHWERVYQTKNPDQVSWTQRVPKASLDLIRSCNLAKNTPIIDIGGGESRLVDFLLEEGYQNITVLDIFATALGKAKQRLGEKAELVNWIVSDITEFEPPRQYELWHDRATFHFLTTPDQINHYSRLVHRSVKMFLLLGTFSSTGPEKCSGLPICQYDAAGLEKVFSEDFEKINCFTEDHNTPFGMTQNFLFCTFQRVSR